MQSICEEATYLTIAHDYSSGPDLIAKIDKIVEKYRPAFIPEKAVCSAYGSTQEPVIRWCFETYPSFSAMLAQAPYGGTTVTYPGYELSDFARFHAGQEYNRGKGQFIPANNMECVAVPEHNHDNLKYLKNGGTGLPNERIFLLTVTCNYPFSNPMVRWLFNRGVNTKIISRNSQAAPGKAPEKKGTMYLLWSRGAGIVNTK